MKSFMAKNHEVIRDWILIDATGLTLGRLAVDIALVLRGKNKPQYTPHIDTGDYVVVINASKIEVSGNKFSSKIYHHHTGTPGGLKSITFKDLQKKSPEKILEIAVKGMLPKNVLGRAMFKKLKIYTGAKHLHEAQNPKKIENLIFRQGLKG